MAGYAGLKKFLHSNDAIKSALGWATNHKTVGAGLNYVSRATNVGFKQAAIGRFDKAAGEYSGGIFYEAGAKGFADIEKMNYGRVFAAGATGMVGLRAGLGAARGVLTDSNGNSDIAGIPGI